MAIDQAAAKPKPRPIWMKIVDPSESRARAFTLGAAATAVMLTGSFLNFLNYYGYPVGSAEVQLVFAGVLAVSAVVGLVAATLGVFAQLVVPVLLVVLAIQLNFGGAFLTVGVLASALLARFARQALILWFGVVVISELWTAATGTAGGHPAAAGSAVQTGAMATKKSDIAVVHLILDEHIGLEAIPDFVPRGPEAREQLRTFYLRHGFRLLAGAYSESLHTVNSIPRILGLEPALPWKQGGRWGTTVEQNRYFDVLQWMGLRITVAQSDWIDYCNHPAVETCMTRAAGGLIDVGDQLPVSDKAYILAFRFAALSALARSALGVYDLAVFYVRRVGLDLPFVQQLQETSTSSLNGMATFEWVIGQTRALTPGQAIFAHVLVPHYPYIYDKACRMLRQSEWRGRASRVSWQARYDAYFDQVECVTHKVEEMLSAIAASPAAGKTVIIIHADHGSRIVQFDPVIENDGRFTDRDLVDGLAAFFAVSAPGIEPGYDSKRYPLRLILDALARSQFRGVTPDLPTGFHHSVKIEDRKWNPIAERSMVDKEWWNEDVD
ncbi:hypothetical protein [Dongia deserti]|uniref:hypothetical protein n=1 Tax=Dongia deserti TaxID=2268030 RepID=UPI000E65CD27|nr:hypothetical protein [Dongia deserti]